MFQDNWQKQYFFHGDENKQIHNNIPFEARIADTKYKILDNGYTCYPFWDIQNIKTSLNIHTLTKNIDDDRTIKEIAVREINTTWGTALHVYSDGSMDKKFGHVGCSFVVPAFKYSHGFRLPGEASILSAELVAILVALEWVDEIKPNDVVIFSDCMSAIISLGKFNSDNKIVCDIQRTCLSLASQGIQIEIVWVPGHVGVSGNEWADVTAKKASTRTIIDIPLGLNMSELKTIHKIQMIQDWQEQWNKYNTQNTFKTIQKTVKMNMYDYDVTKDMEILFRRLRLGKCYFLNQYLYNINKHNDGLCATCRVMEDVRHFLLECTRYKRQREELKRVLQDEDIKFNRLDLVLLLKGKNPPVKEVIHFVNLNNVNFDC